MERRPALLAALLAASLVVTTLAAPALVSARPAYEIPVADVDDGATLDTADGEEWTQAPSAGVPLSSSGAAVPGGDESTVDEVRVASARTDERLYLRVSWADPTRDTAAGDVRQFADAVAVQVPVNESARPPIAMGSTDNRVNVWYWNGLNVSQELLAGGPGTTTVLDDSDLESNATYRDGRWYVVLSRPLTDSSDDRTTFSTERDVDVAVAVWNGSSMERSGAKATSEWYYLALGPGPEGPPYETILWLVAGLGMVFTTLVTIEGIRRTRGE
ncbi:ethylbenzene dehydrogenase-related protein [Haloprofundus halophilus]|uniref:ethylbenzene dehydrogenase-related protein n=1 Tax=Haloprofundus halophilus TaxID=2283527 RepID=UPI000E44CBB8|nr:ethylbenzene dehydrogenase-related protein [Haloprofundus halophilus]